MARASTTSDTFNAVAEPQRREILNLLVHGERSVNDIAELLHLRQPQVSKHLRVLSEVGLVSARKVGHQHLYRLNSAGLKPIYDWVSTFERLWNERLDRLAAYLDELQTSAVPDIKLTTEENQNECSQPDQDDQPGPGDQPESGQPRAG